jgi:DNA-binding transcriptional LysR family regulator
MHRRLLLPSLRQLRAFEAVARSKSIGVGAKTLGLSQPAVTQMLIQLETGLAVTLLERRRNGSFPTPLGSVLLPRVQRLFAHIQSALGDPIVGASLSGRETTRSVENKITDTHIRSLTAITECGSLAAAARRLNISQPSLHRSARDLERVVRRSLYQRMARGLAPTDQARELARRLKVALRELEYGIEEIRAAQGVFTSRITVGNIPHSGTHLLSSTITRFLASYRAPLFTSSMAPTRCCSMLCGREISTCCSGCSDAPSGRPTSGKNFCSRIPTPFLSADSTRSRAFAI